jgi:hypothetical protein
MGQSSVSASGLLGPSMTSVVAGRPAASAPVASRGRHSVVPFAPSAPASGFAGVAAGGAAGGLGLGGLACVLFALVLWGAARLIGSLDVSLALWRPMAFVSIQERPG